MALEDLVPTEDSITALMQNAVAISDLPKLQKTEELDVFTIANHQTELSSNSNIQSQFFDSQLQSWMLEDDLLLSGKWEFGKSSSSSLEIKTRSILDAIDSGLDDVVINNEFFEKHILGAIDQFRSYIFEQQHVPSVVGDVIFSMVLDTESKVIDHYGGTRWNRIDGNKMVVGIGSCSENTITKFGELSAGEFTVNPSEMIGSNSISLDQSEIPSHTHKFIGKPTNVSFNWHYRGSSGEHCCVGVTSNQDWGTETRHWKAKIGSLGGGIKISGRKEISSAGVYGLSLPLDQTVFSENGVAQECSEHSNVPPVLFAYVWERVE